MITYGHTMDTSTDGQLKLARHYQGLCKAM
jgi:hypothetical protein